MPVRRIRSSALLLGTLLATLLTARRSLAQSPLTATAVTPLTSPLDATVLPRGAIRISGLAAFTRSAELFGAGRDSSGGVPNIAANFNAESLGVRQIPGLAAAQTAIRTLSGLTAFSLDAGQFRSIGDTRIATVPITLEYGVTSRLTIGASVPLVETRTVLFVGLDARKSATNVGPNPAFASASLRQANGAFVAAVAAAAAELQKTLNGCQTTPTAGNCAQVIAHAPSLIQQANTDAAALEALYGTDAGGGQRFVPIAGDSAVQGAIDHQLTVLSESMATLDPNATFGGEINAAQSPAGLADVQNLLTDLGRDTVSSTDRSSFGDVTLAATYQLANTFTGDSTRPGQRHLRYRLAVNAGYRIGTGEPAQRNRLFDLSTGYGQPGILAGGAFDLAYGSRWSTSFIGAYTEQLGSVAVADIPNPGNAAFPLTQSTPGTYSAGNVMALTIVPRYRVSGFLSINGQFVTMRTGADRYTYTPLASDSLAAAPATTSFAGLSAATTTQYGIGFSYSTVVAPSRGPGAIPFEVAYWHLETLSGSGGPVPKSFRDEISLRIYFRR